MLYLLYIICYLLCCTWKFIFLDVVARDILDRADESLDTRTGDHTRGCCKSSSSRGDFRLRSNVVETTFLSGISTSGCDICGKRPRVVLAFYNVICACFLLLSCYNVYYYCTFSYVHNYGIFVRYIFALTQLKENKKSAKHWVALFFN